MPAQIDPIVGRYVHVTLQGRPHRLYFEEAGRGIPSGVPVHRGRRWTPVPAPDGGQRDHRRVPRAHLRSSLARQVHPARRLGERGLPADHGDLYRGDPHLCAALELERPVVLGCSIGGRIVLSLAAHHAAEFRALIGLESAASGALVRSRLALPAGRARRGLRRAGVRADRAAEPADRALETLWHYLQGGPGVFKGTFISTGSTATCATRSVASTPVSARSTCLPANTIFLAARRIRCALRSRSPAASRWW